MPCPGGGTGRLASLRGLCSQERVGSNPALGTMQSLFYGLRVGIFFIGGYALFHLGPVMGIFIFATGLFSFLFKLRYPLFLSHSAYADFWELSGTIILFLNSFVLAFLDYNSISYGWLDIPMHLAGGMFVAFWVLLAFEEDFASLALSKSILVILGITALIGVGWEFFEWTFDHIVGIRYHLPAAQVSLRDTMGDLLFDILGGLLVMTSFISQGRKKN